MFFKFIKYMFQQESLLLIFFGSSRYPPRKMTETNPSRWVGSQGAARLSLRVLMLLHS